MAKIGTVIVAEAEPFSGDFDEVEPVSFEEARKAAEYYGGLVEHPFPACFSCGIARPGSDGLGLRPGLLPGREGVTAASWRPDGSLADAAGQVRPEFVWAALDCPGGWTVDVVGRPRLRRTLCVPKTSSTSCDQAIFVDQATDASVSSDAVLVKIDRFGPGIGRAHV